LTAIPQERGFEREAAGKKERMGILYKFRFGEALFLY
jgi:hypothetical protein